MLAPFLLSISATKPRPKESLPCIVAYGAFVDGVGTAFHPPASRIPVGSTNGFEIGIRSTLALLASGALARTPAESNRLSPLLCRPA